MTPENRYGSTALLSIAAVIALLLLKNPASEVKNKGHKKRYFGSQDLDAAGEHELSSAGHPHAEGNRADLLHENARYADELDCRHRQLRLSSTLNWITAGSAAVALIGLVYLFGSLQATRDSVTLARRNAHFDQRAWLGVSFDGRAIPLESGKGLDLLVAVADTGKSPARNAHGIFVTRLLNRNEPLRFNYDHGTEVKLSTVFPGLPQTAVSHLVPSGVPKGHPVAPVIVTPDLLEKHRAGEVYIVVYGWLEYDTVFGGHHRVQFCGADTSVQFSQKECTEYNDIDTDEEP